MITIIHGDDIESSRNFFLEKKGKSNDSITLDGDKIVLSDILQSLQGGSLFFNDSSIFIEKFIISKNSQYRDIVSAILKNHKNFEIYFYETAEVSKKNLSQFKDAVVKNFKLPQSLFYFLDQVCPDNKNSIINFHKALKNSDVDLIFFMLVRQFRLMLALNEPNDTGSLETIDEVKRLAPWQKSKLQNQAKKFSLVQLKTIYNKLFEIDVAQKSGQLQTSLTAAIDFFLLEI